MGRVGRQGRQEGLRVLRHARADEDPRFTVKLRESHEEASALGWTADPGYGLGRGGWLTVNAPEDAPMDLLQSWILESYRAVAPKRLAATLER